MRRLPFLLPLLATTAVLAPTCFQVLAHADDDTGIRHEIVLDTRDGITRSVVLYDDPLSPNALPHSPKCDQVRYMRWRLSNGPADAQDADAVLAAHPGTVEDGAAFDSVARNTLHQLAARGKKAEFWGLDRREVCATDTVGMEAAVAQRDYRVAIDYYYNGKEIDGHRFRGYSDSNEPALADMGLAQIAEDYQFVASHEIPLAADRKRKIFLGGHSQGGILAGHNAAWDFGGDPTTDGGAVEDQLAGVFTFDGPAPADYQVAGQIPIVEEAMNIVAGMPYDLVVAGLRSGILPRAIGLGELGFPAVAQLAKIIGLAARFEPDANSEVLQRIPMGLLQNLPSGLLDNVAARFFTTPDYLGYLTGLFGGNPDPQQLCATNMALLGLILDDNSSPIVAIQSSFGGFTGGPVVIKNQPFPDVLRQIPLLGTLVDFGGGGSTKVAPGDFSGKSCYDWVDYDKLPAQGLYTVDGRRYTGPESEITSATEFADSVGTEAGGMSFIDSYENLRHLLDIGFLATGYRGGELAGFQHPHWHDQLPLINFLGEKSFGLFRGIPNWLSADETYIVPAASHLDGLTAAAQQNDGRPSVPATKLADFVVQHLG
ncbi:hypothetical protein ACIP5Y_15385 [Nocardia sp. NPDC088792]|uniref:hypothetical protein n=1 Tax=Nocardia sp. NPDC088792 TaxID=3364332 RepID=UPI003820FFBE